MKVYLLALIAAVVLVLSTWASPTLPPGGSASAWGPCERLSLYRAIMETRFERFHRQIPAWWLRWIDALEARWMCFQGDTQPKLT